MLDPCRRNHPRGWHRRTGSRVVLGEAMGICQCSTLSLRCPPPLTIPLVNIHSSYEICTFHWQSFLSCGPCLLSSCTIASRWHLAINSKGRLNPSPWLPLVLGSSTASSRTFGYIFQLACRWALGGQPEESLNK
jgi:hypothetical protein